MTITARPISPNVVAVERDDCPKVCLLDAKTYAEIEQTRDENARWRLCCSHALATRTKQEKKT